MKSRKVFSLLLTAALALSCLPVAAWATPLAVPVATSFSTSVPANRQSAVTLLGSDSDGTSLTYAIVANPGHGTLSNLNTSTGVVVYTPVTDYLGADAFTYNVTSGGQTSSTATVTISVTNAKTRIIDTVVNASGAPRAGKVTFILTQPVTTPGGISPAGASVSASLNSSGQFDVSLYPSKSLSPNAYYQVWFADAAGLNRELLGVYEIPLSATAIVLAPYKVTDTNLATRYTFASEAAVSALQSSVASATFTVLLGSSTANRVQKKSPGAGLADSAISDTGTAVDILQPLTVAGNVNATAFIGSGAGLTGIGTGTGGVLNTGSTTAGADTDVDGVGVVDLQTRGEPRLRVENNGFITQYGPLTGTNLSAVVTAVGAAQKTIRIATPQTVAVGFTSPANITLEFTDTGSITVATGETLNPQGPIIAPARPIFFNVGAGEGTLSLASNPYVNEFPVEWIGTPGDGSTDDTPYIQRIIDMFDVANKSGWLLFQNKVYIINGALQDTGASNSQLVLPKRPTTQIAIGFRGVPPESRTAINADTSGTIIKSTLATGNGAMIGTSPRSFLSFYAEHITFRMPVNSTNSGLDLSNVVVFDPNNVKVDTGEVFDSVTQPTTTTSYGVKMPQNNKSGMTNGRSLLIYGFYTGILGGELTRLDSLTVGNCVYALEAPEAFHSNYIGLLLDEHNKNGISATGGASYWNIGTWDIEKAVAGWFTRVTDVVDASNFLYLSGHWHEVTVSAGITHTLAVTGGARLTINELSRAGIATTYTPTVTVQTGSITTLGAVTGRFKQTGKLIWFQASAIINVNGSGAGYVALSLPVVPAASFEFIPNGAELAISGKSLRCSIASGGTTVQLKFYDNTYPGADNARLVVTGTYEIP